MNLSYQTLTHRFIGQPFSMFKSDMPLPRGGPCGHAQHCARRLFVSFRLCLVKASTRCLCLCTSLINLFYMSATPATLCACETISHLFGYASSIGDIKNDRLDMVLKVFPHNLDAPARNIVICTSVDSQVYIDTGLGRKEDWGMQVDTHADS